MWITSSSVAEECWSRCSVFDWDCECCGRESVACHKEVTMPHGGAFLAAGARLRLKLCGVHVNIDGLTSPFNLRNNIAIAMFHPVQS